LQYVLKKHSVDITALLKKLCAENILKSDNNRRWTTYKLVKKGATSQQKDATSDKKSATSPKPTVNKGKTGENSPKKGATSQQKSATSNKKGATSDNKIINQHQRKNLKRDELEKAILEICSNKYIKKEELVEVLGKSESYIRNKIIPGLIKAGKLEKRFPYTNNHPDQGYKTSEE